MEEGSEEMGIGKRVQGWKTIIPPRLLHLFLMKKPAIVYPLLGRFPHGMMENLEGTSVPRCTRRMEAESKAG